MKVSLVEVLRRRGWSDNTFNRNGSKPPYVRIGYSLFHGASIFQPMPMAERWLRPSLSIPVEEVLGHHYFSIDAGPYEEFAAGQWIGNQAHFPFGEWVYPVSFKKSGVDVRTKERGRFFVQYGALIAGSGVIIDV